MKILSNIALILVIVGGLNWGLVGSFGFDLVQWISMGSAVLANTVYVLVGLSAVVLIFTSFKKTATV